uniref:Vacuolar membrane protease n=1 Tax=Phenylobacterium glaciei TaxID=2803784 RepID=A0A974S9A2_9CAUL|nr:M28 family peptidase [Phenylobacterium glaciei]
MEVMRVLKAEGTPARDVVLLLTDGEEAGLLGATGFFQSHPLAKQLGFVINMESRGGGGRANMFETAPANGAVIDLFRKASTAPASSSLIVYLYKQLPNDTDFTVPRKAGIAGLNYAFIARQFDYHSPVSTPENLNQGSLQHLGTRCWPRPARPPSPLPCPARRPTRSTPTRWAITCSPTPPWPGGACWP